MYGTCHYCKGEYHMPIDQESAAVALARALAEAWSHHDWDKARAMLAPDVHVTVTTTQPLMNPTDTTGIDDYTEGLIKFAEPIEPDSAHVIGSCGDERNSLILLTVRTALGPNGEKVTLSAARLALFDENQKLQQERAIFFVVPD
jgi:SnoaL-like domain